MLRLDYLPVNQAFAFLFGEQLCDMRGQYLFNTRADAIEAARSCGLRVDRDGLVHVA